MSEIEFKIEPKIVFGLIFVLLGIVVVFISVVGAFLGYEHISSLMGSELTETEAFVEIFGWFFALLIEALGGYFIASIGMKIIKK